MSVTLGKKFEAKVKEDLSLLPDCSIDRLHDQTTGYKITSQNPSDYIFYKYPNEYYIECKTTAGASFSFNQLTQYNLLIEKCGIPGVRAGVVIWFYEKDTILYVPVKTVQTMKEEGKKSLNYKLADSDTYRIIKVPSVKKRTFMDSDYSVLLSLQDGD